MSAVLMTRKFLRQLAREQKRAADLADYQKLLAEYGITDADRLEADASGVYEEIESGREGIYYHIAKSEIIGKGCYASIDFAPFQTVGVHTTDAMIITGLGQFTNHGHRPNCRLEWRWPNYAGPLVTMIAITPIYQGEELTIDYRSIVGRQFRKVDA